MSSIVDYDQVTEENKGIVLQEWLDRLTVLVDLVEGWVKDLGWATRRISKRMEDSRLGTYRAPALIMQRDLVQIALEPIGRFAPRCDGVVDLYLMPALDDMASLYYENGEWHLMFDGSPTVCTMRDAEEMTLTRDILTRVLDVMVAHGA
jgi:hypothetical protein